MADKPNTPGRRVGRREQMRQQHAREQRRRNLMIGIPAALTVIAIVVLIVTRTREPNIEGVERFPDQAGGRHDDSVVYPTGGLPPAGGVHAPTWQNCGIYDTPVETKHAIHSMEHGAAWVAYNPTLPADDVAALQALVQAESRGYILMTPYTDLDGQIVLTAWERQLVVDSAGDERIREFIDYYQSGPTKPETASCSGGVGTPLS